MKKPEIIRLQQVSWFLPQWKEFNSTPPSSFICSSFPQRLLLESLMDWPRVRTTRISPHPFLEWKERPLQVLVFSRHIPALQVRGAASHLPTWVKVRCLSHKMAWGLGLSGEKRKRHCSLLLILNCGFQSFWYITWPTSNTSGTGHYVQP